MPKLRHSNVVQAEKPGGGVSHRVFCFVIAPSFVISLGVAGIRFPHSPDAQRWHGKGTLANFSQEVLRRCSSYHRGSGDMGEKHCPKIVKAFENAFLSKDPCQITEEDYQHLLKLTKQEIPCGKSLFWSKTKKLVQQYTREKKEFFTLENTLLGHLADGLSWCGNKGSSEMNYHSCPHWREDCMRNPVSVFWTVASRRFAGSACGDAMLILNGSLKNAFDRNSMFGRTEVNHLDPRKVHTLQVWVIQNQKAISSDSCLGSSINDLKSILSKKNITFACRDINSLNEIHVSSRRIRV